MTTPVLTVAELQAYVRSELVLEDSIYQAAIDTAVGIASSGIGRAIVVADPAVSTARVFRPSNGNLQLIDDAAAIVAVVDSQGTLVSGTDYQPEPLNGINDIGESVPYYALRRLGYYYQRWFNWFGIPNQASITVTARWGWPAIPPLMKESIKIIAKDVFNNRNTTGFGLVTVTDAGGVGTRENAIVNKMIYTYAHPGSIVVG